MKKRVLITGGTGFLGIHLARHLLKKNYAVTLLDKEKLDSFDLAKKVNVVIGDIRDKHIVDQAMKNQDYVVHAAAALPVHSDMQVIFNVNVEGTRIVLESAKRQHIKRLIFISTTAVYGISKYLPATEEAPLHPIGYYGLSKAEGEKLCLAYHIKGLPVTILRPTTFLGTERLGIFTIWFEAIFKSQRVFLLGSGKNTHQLLAVTDLVSAIEKSFTAETNGEIINIGAKEYGTWRSDLGHVIEQAHSNAQITSLPTRPAQIFLRLLESLHLSPIAAFHYKTMPVDYYVSINKAEKLLHWEPIKSNKQLFLESYLWYKQHRNSIIGRTGTTHRVSWNMKALNWISKL